MKRKIIIALEVYLILTIFIYACGPIAFPEKNDLKVYIFLIVYHICFLGGILSTNIIQVRERGVGINKILKKRKNLLIRCALIFSFFFSYYGMKTIVGTWSPIEILKFSMASLGELGEAYLSNLEIIRESGMVTTLSTLLSCIYYVGIPLGIYFYGELTKGNKILLIGAIGSEILLYVCKGTNIGIFKIVIIMGAVALIKGINLKKYRKKIILVAIFFIIFFIIGTTERMGLTEGRITSSLWGVYIDYDHIIFKGMPQFLWSGLLMVFSYISQGYYGMAIGLDYQHTPMWGIGNSNFFMQKFEQMTGESVFHNTFQYKMDFFWDSRVNWHTAYTWFANDVGFVGVTIVMLLLGIMFSWIIEDALKKNVLAISLLPLYCIMIFFLPANNVVLSTPTLCMPFIFLNIIWILSKRLVIVRGKK